MKAEDMKHICKKSIATNTLYLKLQCYLKSKQKKKLARSLIFRSNWC